MTVLIDIILISVSLAVIAALFISFRADPYAYRNIVLLGLFILTTAMIIGRCALNLRSSGEMGDIFHSMAFFLWDFSRVLFIPISFICLFLCISNIVLLKREGFRRSNFIGLVISAAYLIALSMVWRPLNEMPPAVNDLMIFLRLMLCYGECTFLSIFLTGHAVLKIAPLYDRDYAIILGCSISKKGKVRPLLKGRVNRAIRFAWEQETITGKAVKYVPSGGQGKDEPMSEGSAMEMYLLSHSAEDYEVFPEKRSVNTRENLVFSKQVIDALKENAKVAVVTSDFHVLRSGMLSRKTGLENAEVIGSKTVWYFWPNAFIREIIAIAAMNLKVHIAVALLCGVIAVL